MDPLLVDEAGRELLLLGTEAIARGALEAGVRLCAACPGSPSSEILAALARVADYYGVQAEWSANAKVALEAACGASFAGQRALASMKQDGMNVAADTLTAVALTGCRGGLVVVVCDDPGGLCSTNEVDSRHYAPLADLPLLEPGDVQDAKDLVRKAFDLSEEFGLPCLVRSVTRISHSHGVVRLGERAGPTEPARVGADDRWGSHCVGQSRQALKHKLRRVQARFEGSPFNRWEGPERPELAVVACGTGGSYATEAVRLLGVEGRVGVLSLATTWPLPVLLLREHLDGVPALLVAEEPDPFCEVNIRAWLTEGHLERVPRVLGKLDGIVRGPCGSGVGELSPDLLVAAIASALELDPPGRPPSLGEVLGEDPGVPLPPREVDFCPGCLHRASYWAMKNALRIDGRDGVLIGDIGCYSLGLLRTAYRQSRTMHSMGSSVGVCAGLGQLGRFGLSQPVLAVVDDSTFFHACLPGLVSARYNGATFVCVVVDSGVMAMTGFQPHPGAGRTAASGDVARLSIESACEGMGIPVRVADPFDLPGTTRLLVDLLRQDRLQAVVLRHDCTLRAVREGGLPDRRVWVEPDRCLGEECGRGRVCSAAS